MDKIKGKKCNGLESGGSPILNGRAFNHSRAFDGFEEYIDTVF